MMHYSSRIARMREQLQENLVVVHDRVYLLAGSHQYRTLWTRDVCFALLRLLKDGFHADYQEIAHNTVELYLDYVKDGYGPKCIDFAMNAESRVILTSVSHIFCCCREPSGPSDEDGVSTIHPMYTDGRGSVAIDSNLLVYMLAKASLYNKQRKKVDELLDWVEGRRNAQGFIEQGAYSDWQDSQDRSPVTFLTQLMYWRALMLSGRERREEAADLHNRMVDTFFDESTNLYFAQLEPDKSICLEDQLFAIEWGFEGGEDAKRERFGWLVASDLWKGGVHGPGFATSPNYSTCAAHWQAKIACLGQYHGALYWSWLMAFAGIVAFDCGFHDQANEITVRLDEMEKRDGSIGEVYTPGYSDVHPPELFRSCVYTSEMPWTWGLAYTIALFNRYDDGLEKQPSRRSKRKVWQGGREIIAYKSDFNIA
jgi:hypothetical protein